MHIVKKHETWSSIFFDWQKSLISNVVELQEIGNLKKFKNCVSYDQQFFLLYIQF